ncbi:Gag-Pol polyprotein [Gossypium australe]|uniref:Gag-Pol polyprotein n=1 Tax=Gossypium australe TaxID=47621 RepID=A0A5B6VCW5_9ROSI|nr:Gag-Pol polyprotein [Gossypium australe]
MKESSNRISETIGSPDHYKRDCSNRTESNRDQNSKPISTSTRGRRPMNSGAIGVNRSGTKDTTVLSEARAPARAYAIFAHEEASALHVIASTFSIFDVTIYSLVDPGSTHSYICTTLVTEKNLPVESTDYVIKVMNPLGYSVLVDLGYDFPTDLMLLPFNEFGIILGMDWFMVHDVVVNCH